VSAIPLRPRRLAVHQRNSQLRVQAMWCDTSRPNQPARGTVLTLVRFRLLPCVQTGDGTVNVSDLLALLAVFGQSGALDEDISTDGIVNVEDLLLLLSDFGQGC
jgi:hypothetical protein